MAFAKRSIGESTRRFRGCMHAHAWTGGKAWKLRNVEMTPVIVVVGAHLVLLRVVITTGGSHSRGMHVRIGIHAVIKHHSIVETIVVVAGVIVGCMPMILAVVIGHITSRMITHVRMVMRRWILLIMMIVLRLNGWAIGMIVVVRRRMVVLRMPIHALIVMGRGVFLSPASSFVCHTLLTLGGRLWIAGAARPRSMDRASIGMESSIQKGLSR
jgi:hypothetical protein